MKILSKLFVSALLLCLSVATIAQNTLKSTQLNIFKNGTYFVVKEGTVNIQNNRFDFPVPPSPLLSTFWLTTSKDLKLERIDFKNDSIKVKRQITGYLDVVQQLLNKKIKITYLSGDKLLKEVSGTLLFYTAGMGMLKIKTADNKYVYVSGYSIQEVSSEELLPDQLAADSISRQAHAYFNKNGSYPIKLTFMQTGMTWTPTYNLKILNDKEVQIEMKAVVENFMEKDINNTELTLTVGSPNFYYGTQVDPISGNYLSSTASYGWSYPVQRYDNAVQSVSLDEATVATGNTYNNYQTYTTTGDKSQDLYFYKLGKVDLPYGIKTAVNIFSANVPYKDVYEVNVNDIVSYYSYRYIRDTDNNPFDVFHSIRLTNSTNQPFTTGPAFVLDENLNPLAQDQLKYTPVKNDVSLQLSKAIDVIVKNNEEEVTRAENFTTINKVRYTKVTIKGSISIENSQNKTINLLVTKNLNGKTIEVSDNGNFKNPNPSYNVNPFSELKWDLQIKAGEKKKITYSYEVLINI